MSKEEEKVEGMEATEENSVRSFFYKTIETSKKKKR